ncbi:MAG: hypothetical protein ACLPXT_01410 [Terracidiphilus sp.]
MPFNIKLPFKRQPFSRRPITLARVLEYREKIPKRLDFIGCHQDSLTREAVSERPDIIGKFVVPFVETIRPLFEKETGLDLFQSKFKDGMWRSVHDEAEFARIQEWILAQGTRKFLRNCLDLSIALDYNIANIENGQYTEIGALEHRAKPVCDAEAVASLSKFCADTIQNLHYYRDTEFIVAVPTMSAKQYDLPSQVAARVSVALSKKNLTDCFAWDHAKQKPLKGARIEEKWTLLEATGLRFNCSISNKSDVILIDDKYQSGTTMQFVAMKLQEAGARFIFGISLVKTLRDTDNASKG